MCGQNLAAPIWLGRKAEQGHPLGQHLCNCWSVTCQGREEKGWGWGGGGGEGQGEEDQYWTAPWGEVDKGWGVYNRGWTEGLGWGVGSILEVVVQPASSG